MLSAYEVRRLGNIAANAAMLKKLGIHEAAASVFDKKKEAPKIKNAKKRKRGHSQSVKQARVIPVTRRSRRVSRLPPPVYVPTCPMKEQEDQEKLRRRQLADGHRSEVDGKWRGERFGEVLV